jgi:predicted ATPase/DNA-binding winged helix-turn-helix (wHTH) protein
VRAGNQDRDRVNFGQFLWLRRQRVLLRGGRPVRLGSRAKEILGLLLESPGELVRTETLRDQVWPGTVVVEVAVRVHMAALRKIIKQEPGCSIDNIHGIGYRFTRPSARAPAGGLIGREGLLASIGRQVMQHRLLTLVGPGGSGKSALARAITAPPELEPEAPLVMDDCDHHLPAARATIEGLLEKSPRLRILATSREPLGLPGEYVMRIPGLELPSPAAQQSAALALSFPAVRLFVTRAAASADGFELTDANVAAVARICTELDGLPLALELAAARVPELGLSGLALPAGMLLDLLTRGRRTAAPCHRTLRGMLSRSYDILEQQQQLALRRLAAFPGSFDRTEAAAAIVDAQLPESKVDQVLERLTAASILESDTSTTPVRYYLLKTYRAYALADARAHFNEIQSP